MKKLFFVVVIIISLKPAMGQSQEAQQLLLNVEKLAQFKKILQNMYDGYKLLHTGYTAIKDISQGNFSLHKLFLDRLLEVSPVVKKYKRITDIIDAQLALVKEYRAAFREFRDNGEFTVAEVDYLGKVYSNLFDQSLKNLDELLLVVTAGNFRMSDDERLAMIDRVYKEVTDQLAFLREFNTNTAVLALQRKNERAEIELSRRLGGH